MNFRTTMRSTLTAHLTFLLLVPLSASAQNESAPNLAKPEVVRRAAYDRCAKMGW